MIRSRPAPASSANRRSYERLDRRIGVARRLLGDATDEHRLGLKPVTRRV